MSGRYLILFHLWPADLMRLLVRGHHHFSFFAHFTDYCSREREESRTNKREGAEFEKETRESCLPKINY